MLARTIALLLVAACAHSSEPQPTTHLPVPGVLDIAHYDAVRADTVLGPAVDEQLIPTLLTDNSHAQRAAAFTAAHDAAALAWRTARERGAQTAAPTPSTEGPGPHQLLSDFDRVCTDVLRSWLRTEATAIAAQPHDVEQAAADIDALAEVGATALTWDLATAQTARVELHAQARALRDSAP